MAKRIADHLGMKQGESVCDFGCSRGYLVRAFKEQGFNAYGVDVSDWAIANCDEAVKGKVNLGHKVCCGFDWITAKDTLEHLSIWDVAATLRNFAEKAQKGVFIVVPLAPQMNAEYAVPEYEKDITHNIRWPLWRWVSEMLDCFDETWEITASYRIVGIKDNYAGWPKGNGFITLRRTSQVRTDAGS